MDSKAKLFHLTLLLVKSYQLVSRPGPSLGVPVRRDPETWRPVSFAQEQSERLSMRGQGSATQALLLH